MRFPPAVVLLSLLATLSSATHAQDSVAASTPSAALATVLCAPRMAPPVDSLRTAVHVLGGIESPMRIALSPGERLVLDAGSDRGLRAGDRYLARRIYPTLQWGEDIPSTFETAGWVEVETVLDATAVARVVWACDGILTGDALEPFDVQTPPQMASKGTPDFEAAHIVLAGRDARRAAATGEQLLVENGDQSFVPGQRVTFFRRPYATERSAGPVTVLGEGYVLAVANGGAAVQIVGSLNAIESGDLAAPHR